jgi:hypothetical protein
MLLHQLLNCLMQSLLIRAIDLDSVVSVNERKALRSSVLTFHDENYPVTIFYRYVDHP